MQRILHNNNVRLTFKNLNLNPAHGKKQRSASVFRIDGTKDSAGRYCENVCEC